MLPTQVQAAPRAWIALLRTHAATTRALSGQLVADHGLTINDYEALLRLARAEERRMRRVDLAEALLLTASGVTRLLDGLESAGLVERATCASDRRVVYAVLTDAGWEKLKEASESHLGQVWELFDGRYEEHELAHLAELLGRLPGGDAAVAEACAPE
jgi:DNA-binding MarR family transcriptional regulator